MGRQQIKTNSFLGMVIWAALLMLRGLPSTVSAQALKPPANESASIIRQPLAFTGVNLAGGEFNHPEPGKRAVYGKNYVYPSTDELEYFAHHGVNVIRLPFRWENLQPTLNGPFDPDDLVRIEAVVKAATDQGLAVLLDPHNYDRYYGQLVGSPEVPDAAFADFWAKLAARFRDNGRVWFGLMNEPFDVPPERWLASANAAIAAIRQTGASNLILVPGTAWTGAHSWLSSGNGAAMLGVQDPQHHFVFEVHQYLDPDSSGGKPETVSATIGRERLEGFTRWCREHHQRAFLGEFAAGNTPTGALAIGNLLGHMERNADVWEGYAWWAAGPWWGDYMFSLEPKDGLDAPFLRWLAPHLQGVSP